MSCARPLLVALVTFCVVLAPACYASHTRERDGGRLDAGATRDTPVARPDAGPCEPFPSFDRGCARAEDCSVGFHQTDCCGTVRALGLAERVRAAFSELEVRCRAEYPDCMCAAGPTTADDGSTAASDMPAVACLAGTCTTSFSDD